METLFDFFKVVLPAIITSLFTFFITKYNINRNAPLDKLEIAYNRVYYPLYRLIKDESISDNGQLFIDKAKYYFDKYNKYIDRSTLRAFQFLCKSNTNAKRKSAYRNIKNNILDENSYLRRRLGYLEPNVWQIYTYSSDSDKSTFRILMEFLVANFFIFAGSITHGKLQLISITVFSLFIVFIIIECICKFVSSIYYKIRK